MNRSEFDDLAQHFGEDVTKDGPFTESGYGICFAFDLAYALEAYRVLEAKEDASRIAELLSRAEFSPGLGFSAASIADEAASDDFDTARWIYEDIMHCNMLEQCIAALDWFDHENPNNAATK